MRTINGAATGRKALLAGGFVVFLAVVWGCPALRWLIPACMLAGVSLGVARGRGPWCGKYCLRGNFLEVAGGALNPGGKVPAVFSRPWARYLALSLLMGVMSFNLYAAWPDYRAVGMVFVVLLTATTAVALVFSAVFQRRAWCAVCPVGTISDACRKKL